MSLFVLYFLSQLGQRTLFDVSKVGALINNTCWSLNMPFLPFWFLCGYCYEYKYSLRPRARDLNPIIIYIYVCECTVKEGLAMEPPHCCHRSCLTIIISNYVVYFSYWFGICYTYSEIPKSFRIFCLLYITVRKTKIWLCLNRAAPPRDVPRQEQAQETIAYDWSKIYHLFAIITFIFITTAKKKKTVYVTNIPFFFG